MASTEASRSGRWRAAITWGGGLLLIVAIAAVMNRQWGAGSASAQAPPRNSTGGPSSGGTATGGTTTGKSTAVRPATGAQPAGPAKSTGPVQTAGPAPAGPATSRTTVPASANAPVKGGSTKSGIPAKDDSNELKVMAVVNGEQITRQDLAREAVLRYGEEVLQSMVNKHLILQACAERNIKITEQDVNDEIEKTAKKFGLPIDRWMQLLQEERNISPVEYRREVIWPTLALRSLSADRVNISQEELRKAFESEYGPKVRVRVISTSNRKKADELRAKAVADPEAFNNLAKDHSEDPSASVMGLVPPIRRHAGDPNFEKVAFGLKKGDISPVVTVANQHIVMKCEEHIDGIYFAGKDLKDRENQLRERLRDQKIRTTSADLFKQLQESAKVVNVYNNAEMQKQMPGVAATINGKPVTMRELSEECILRHGATVLDGEINRKILLQELKRRNHSVSDDDIQEEVARAADSYGFSKKDGTPDIDAWLKQVTENDKTTVDLYVRDAVWPSAALKKLVGGAADVTEDDLVKGFEANYGERVEVLAIVLSNQRQAQQVWELARDNPTENFFGQLANQYSIEPASRANFGKVPPIRRHNGQTLLEDAAFKMKPGELSPIVAVGDKFVVLKCQGRTKPVVESMSDDVRSELVKDITEKKLRAAMGKEFDRLKTDAQVDNFLAGTSQAGARSSVARVPGKSPTGPVGGVPPTGPAPVVGPAAAKPIASGAAPQTPARAGTIKR